MTVYLDVAAVRIQSYLTRWPSLVGRRAASDLVNVAFRDDFLDLPNGLQVHDEAGIADGVLHLRYDEGAESDCRADARSVLAQLRRTLVGLDLEAVWGEGSTYAEAYADGMQPMIERGGGESWFAAINEVPHAQRCTLTATDPAVDVIDWHGRRAAGRDAVARHARRGAGEAAMLEGARVPCDFEELAAAPVQMRREGDPPPKQNHLATVFADGNAIGRLFQRLRSLDVAAERIQEVSRGLKRATREALDDAIEAVAPNGAADRDRLQPCIVHILGGDDVLVSVPAPVAFAFTRQYLKAFRTKATALVAGLGAEAPTASAGVVIAHSSYPIARSVALAERLLRQAKAARAGREATLAWIDVTHHGTEPCRRVFEVDELEGADGDLSDIASWNNSLRASLQAHAAVRPPQVAHARLLVEFARAGRPKDTDRQRALAQDPERFDEFLELARWW